MWHRGKLTRCVSPPSVRDVNLSHAVWRHHVPPTGYHTHNHYKLFKCEAKLSWPRTKYSNQSKG